MNVVLVSNVLMVILVNNNDRWLRLNFTSRHPPASQYAVQQLTHSVSQIVIRSIGEDGMMESKLYDLSWSIIWQFDCKGSSNFCSTTLHHLINPALILKCSLWSCAEADSDWEMRIVIICELWGNDDIEREHVSVFPINLVSVNPSELRESQILVFIQGVDTCGDHTCLVTCHWTRCSLWLTRWHAVDMWHPCCLINPDKIDTGQSHKLDNTKYKHLQSQDVKSQAELFSIPGQSYASLKPWCK